MLSDLSGGGTHGFSLFTPFIVLRAKPEQHRQYGVPEVLDPLLLTDGRGDRIG